MITGLFATGYTFRTGENCIVPDHYKEGIVTDVSFGPKNAALSIEMFCDGEGRS